jgi:hypothetical protein
MPAGGNAPGSWVRPNIGYARNHGAKILRNGAGSRGKDGRAEAARQRRLTRARAPASHQLTFLRSSPRDTLLARG